MENFTPMISAFCMIIHNVFLSFLIYVLIQNLVLQFDTEIVSYVACMYLLYCTVHCTLKCFIVCCYAIEPSIGIEPWKYVTEFVKRGLPHLSNSMSLEYHNLLSKKYTNLKFFPCIKVLTTEQIAAFF